jgi:hypothetical protein
MSAGVASDAAAYTERPALLAALTKSPQPLMLLTGPCCAPIFQKPLAIVRFLCAITIRGNKSFDVLQYLVHKHRPKNLDNKINTCFNNGYRSYDLNKHNNHSEKHHQ